MATQTFSYTTDASVLTVRTKTPAFHSKAAELYQQHRVLLPMMRRSGTLMFNQDVSFTSVWDAVTELPSITEWSDDVLPNFTAGPVPLQFNLQDGTYIGDDKFTQQQWLRMKGSRTLIENYYDRKSRDLAKSMAHKINFEIFHGDGTGRRITGFDGALATGTTVAADLVAEPSDTYAGQSTAVGTNGSWTTTSGITAPNANIGTDWPLIGNQTTYDEDMSAYDAVSPLILNTSSTSWEDGTEWKNNCEEVLRWGISVQTARGGAITNGGRLTLVCGEQRLRQARSYFSTKNYALLPVKEVSDWGMPETFEFEGAWLTMDSDVPSDKAYGFYPEVQTFCSPMSNLWEAQGPEYVMMVTAHLYLVTSMFKMQLQPKFLCLFDDVA